MLAVIQQQVAQTSSSKVGIELLVFGRGEAQRQLIAGQRIRIGFSTGTATGIACIRTGSSRVEGASHLAVCQWQLGQSIAIDARKMGKKIAIDCSGEIDETEFTCLVLWFIDDGDIIAGPNIHWLRVAVVLVGNIEGTAIRTDVCDESGVASSAKGPDTISPRKDGKCPNARSCTYRQTCLLGLNSPTGSITPVEG